jgi:Asp-tRNA(Asn)/Glu-tRNA(Gln) amidotransferase C subunit
MSLTLEQVHRVAHLARIEISDAEAAARSAT